jgi:uncharacterized repeat protein (TIGR01451 family)
VRKQRLLLALLLAPALLLAWVSILQAGNAQRQLVPQTMPPSVVEQSIRSVLADALQAHVCHLQDDDALGYCNTQGNRFSYNAEGLNEAAEYIAGQLQAYGLITTAQVFTLANSAPDQFASAVLTNVIGTRVGMAPEKERGVLLITAHYDSIAPNAWEAPAPGADDNASGVAAMLEAARLLSQHAFWHTLRFVAFAGEEEGLHGSRYYATEAKKAGENIVGVINADMISYNGDGIPHMEVHAGRDPHNMVLAGTFTRTVQDYALDLMPQTVLDNPIRLSDHAPFWERGFPAVLVIEDTNLTGPTHDFNPHYHTSGDTLDKVDTVYFTEMAQAIVGTAARLAQPAGPDLRITQAGPTVVEPAQVAAFRLMFTNAGTEPALDVVITNTLSHGLLYRADSSGVSPTFDLAGRVIWRLGNIAAGATETFIITTTARAYLVDTSSVSSRTVIAGRNLDADAIDNVSTVIADVRTWWQVRLPFLVRNDP